METTVKTTGNEITMVNPEAIYELCERLGLMWAVKKEELLLPNGLKSGYYGVVRQDNNAVFSAVKETYEVFQNWEVMEIVTRVAETLGKTVENAGMFDGGAKTFIQIERPDFKVNGDTVKRWSTAINSFDGSTALRWGTQNLTISCQNTFWASYKALTTSIKHTRNMRSIVEQSLKALEKIEEQDKTLFEIFTNMYHTPAKEDQIKKVIQLVSGVDVNKTQQSAQEDYSTRKINIARELSTSIVTELANKGNTLWGLWSGVTHFTTHKASSDNAREKSKLMGSLQRTDESILEEIMGYINGFVPVNR
jgi:prefoldin subunit 5